MIKFTQCIKARPDLSAEEFRSHWQQYKQEVKALAEAIGGRRFAVSTTLQVEANLQVMMLRGTGYPFDSMVEVYFESGRDLAERLDQPEAKAASEVMQEHQKAFVDFARSSFFFSTEDVLIDD